MKIQTILIPKSWGYFKAKAWIKEHKFKTQFYKKKPELIANYWHFRQNKKGAGYVAKKLSNGIVIIILFH